MRYSSIFDLPQKYIMGRIRASKMAPLLSGFVKVLAPAVVQVGMDALPATRDGPSLSD
jgi:hypothetical protein